MTDADVVAALRTARGAALLDVLPPYDEARVLAVSEDLRRAGHDPVLVAAALTQSRLRSRAVAKFGDRAASMLFTPDGLEQASRPAVAQHHAQRFAAAGLEHVWDLGCGIGSDAMAFAAAGLAVTAVDADAVTVQTARANLSGLPRAEVCRARAQDVGLPEPPAQGHGCWLDPARRVTGVADSRGRTRRVGGLGRISPSWDFVRTLHPRVPAVGAKMSPSFPRAQAPDGAEAQWLSYGGEALEATLWWGDPVTRPGIGVAVHDGARWHTIPPASLGQADPERAVEAGEPAAEYLYDPDHAVLAAGRLDAVQQEVGGRELWPGSGYLTAERAVTTPFARCLRVREVLPARAKTLREWARRHDVGALTLKKHGGGVDPEALRAQVRPRGTQQATLVLTRERHGSGSRAVAIWVSPAACTP